MIPFQTLLALLTLLMMLATGCTQKAPPYPSQARNQNGPNNKRNDDLNAVKPGPVADTRLALDNATNPSEWKLSITGIDAAKIYALMEIAPEVDPVSKRTQKLGTQFDCSYLESDYSCAFHFKMPSGEIPISPAAPVKHVAAEGSREDLLDHYLNISRSDTKITLTVKLSFADQFYAALQSQVSSLDRANRKWGMNIECEKVADSSSKEVPNKTQSTARKEAGTVSYEASDDAANTGMNKIESTADAALVSVCTLRFDTSDGSVDKVTPVPVQ